MPLPTRTVPALGVRQSYKDFIFIRIFVYSFKKLINYRLTLCISIKNKGFLLRTWIRLVRDWLVDVGVVSILSSSHNKIEEILSRYVYFEIGCLADLSF